MTLLMGEKVHRNDRAGYLIAGLVLLLVLPGFLRARPLLGQTATGSVVGTVTDKGGNAITWRKHPAGKHQDERTKEHCNKLQRRLLAHAFAAGILSLDH